MPETSAIPTISYDDYAKTYRTRVFGGAAILFAGVALIFFCGCFLIGILVLIDRAWNLDGGTPHELDKSAVSLMTILYAMSGVCFVAGAILVGKGFVSLSRTLAERP